MNEAGVVFWILVGASVCLCLIAVGLVASIIQAHRPDDFD